MERRTRALNLNVVRDARDARAAAIWLEAATSVLREQVPLNTRRAGSQFASQRSLTPTRAAPSGIKAAIAISIKIVKPFLSVLRTELVRM